MQEIKAAYHAMIELLDDVIGGVLATARCSATAAYTAEGVTLLRRTGKGTAPVLVAARPG